MSTTLRLIARPYEGFENALEEQIESFTEDINEDVTIERDHRPLPEIHEELIQDRGFEDGTYDLFLCLSDWVPSVVDKGLVDPITRHVNEEPPEGWPEAWADTMRTLMTYDDETYGIPYHDGPECFHYRTDLFENEDEQEAFREEYGRPLHVPKTWEEFLEVAGFFTRPEEDLWGTVVAALPDGHNNVYDFFLQLWSRGGQLLDEEMQPGFNSETGVEALQFYHDLIHEYEVAPPEATEMESVDTGVFFSEGKAAMMWNWAGFGALSEQDDAATFGNVNYSLIPRGDEPDGKHTSLTSLYGLTIPSSSDNKELAYQFIRHTASPEMDKVTTTNGASGCRLSTWRDPEVLRDQSFYPITEKINTGNVNTLPQIPEYTEFNEIMNETVEKVVVEQSAVPGEALDEAADRTRELLGNSS